MTAWNPTDSVQVIINGSIYGSELDVYSLSVTGGRTSNGYQPEPMQANFDLIPSTGYLSYNLMDEVEITVTDPSTSNNVTIFFGYIQDVQFNYALYGNGVGQRRYSITALDPTATLQFAKFNGSPTINQASAGAQIAQALSYWQYPPIMDSGGGVLRYTTSPTSNPTINDQSGSTYDLDQINMTSSDNLGEFIIETASQVNGCLYFKPQNKMLYFDGVARRSGRTAFQLGYDEIRPDITLTESIGMVLNKVLVTRTGTDASNSNTTSITEFGRRDFTRDTRIHNLTDAQTKAANYLTAFSNVSSGSVVRRWRPSTISVDLHNPNLTHAKRSSLLNVFCGSTVDVNVPDPTGVGTFGKMTLNCYIEGWQWSFGPQQLTFTATLALISDLPE